MFFKEKQNEGEHFQIEAPTLQIWGSGAGLPVRYLCSWLLLLCMSKLGLW